MASDRRGVVQVCVTLQVTFLQLPSLSGGKAGTSKVPVPRGNCHAGEGLGDRASLELPSSFVSVIPERGLR